MLQLAVLISGRGSNMIKLAEAIAVDQLNARIAIVISNQQCEGITHAANLGIQTKVIERQNFTTRRNHDLAIQDAITSSSADYVFLAGYMAILGANFTSAFAGRMINIHPSLLPDFKGLDTHQRAIVYDVNSIREGGLGRTLSLPPGGASQKGSRRLAEFHVASCQIPPGVER